MCKTRAKHKNTFGHLNLKIYAFKIAHIGSKSEAIHAEMSRLSGQGVT